MKELTLKIFAHVDFRKSEETNFNEFRKTPYGANIKKGEGVMFISMKEDQYVFVEPPDEFNEVDAKGRRVRVKVIASQRFRIRGTTWSPEMLSLYGERAGYRIHGIKVFEKYLKDRVLQAAKKVERAA